MWREERTIRKKAVNTAIIIFLVYAVAIVSVLFVYSNPTSVPEAWAGTPADPNSYMTPDQLKDASSYARIRDALYFLNTPFQWVVLFIGLVSGFFAGLHAVLQRKLRNRIISGLLFIFAVYLLLELAQLPFSIASYVLARGIGLSNMAVSFWLIDYAKSFGVSFLMTLPIVMLVYFLIGRSEKKWWAWVSVCIAPLMFFMIFIQPVIIDPIFNTFSPLRESETKREILALAEKADIPTNQVYEVNMSERTNLINAYVTGIGQNTRIVIWDTTIEKMTVDEIKFIMAHEMGHYVMRHVFWGACLAVTGSVFIIYFIYLISNYVLRRWGKSLRIDTMASIKSLPLLLLLMSVLSFLSTPLETYVSRGSERAADTYALHMTKDAEAAISGFKKLALTGKTETNPPALIKWWRYTHPSTFERLQNFIEYENGQK